MKLYKESFVEAGHSCQHERRGLVDLPCVEQREPGLSAWTVAESVCKASTSVCAWTSADRAWTVCLNSPCGSSWLRLVFFNTLHTHRVGAWFGWPSMCDLPLAELSMEISLIASRFSTPFKARKWLVGSVTTSMPELTQGSGSSVCWPTRCQN